RPHERLVDRPHHRVALVRPVPGDRQRDDDVADAARLDDSDLHVDMVGGGWIFRRADCDVGRIYRTATDRTEARYRSVLSAPAPASAPCCTGPFGTQNENENLPWSACSEWKLPRTCVAFTQTASVGNSGPGTMASFGSPLKPSVTATMIHMTASLCSRIRPHTP